MWIGSLPQANQSTRSRLGGTRSPCGLNAGGSNVDDCDEALEGFVTVGIGDGGRDTTVSSTSMGVCKEWALGHLSYSSGVVWTNSFIRLINRHAQDWVAQEIPLG